MNSQSDFDHPPVGGAAALGRLHTHAARSRGELAPSVADRTSNYESIAGWVQASRWLGTDDECKNDCAGMRYKDNRLESASRLVHGTDSAFAKGHQE